jgi:hypothetical protein
MSYPASRVGTTLLTIIDFSIIEGLAVMRLLVLCALAIGAGILLFIGFLITAQELFSESIFGAPDESGEETRRRYTDEERSTSSPSSSNPIG